MLFAAARSRPVTDAAAEAATASVATSAATAMVRPFIEYPQRTPDGLLSLRASGDQDGGSALRLAYTSRSRRREWHIRPLLVKTNLRSGSALVFTRTGRSAR